jgi:hypothetical protein
MPLTLINKSMEGQREELLQGLLVLLLLCRLSRKCLGVVGLGDCLLVPSHRRNLIPLFRYPLIIDSFLVGVDVLSVLDALRFC